MRTLLLMQGCPGSGKSTWIKENGLEPYTLSADKIRVMVENPILNEEGNYIISQKNDKYVWDLLFHILENRMKRGDFTVIDATHNNDKLIKRYKDLCDTYKYTMFIKKMDTPLNQCLENNKKRDKYQFVPEDKIKLMHNRIQNIKILSWYNYIDKIEEINNFYTMDMDVLYKRIVVVGDIHGCIEPLDELFQKYTCYDPSTAYIFLGDYIDRGLDNLAVMNKMIELSQYSNIYFLEGNHEGILKEYSKLDITGKKSFDEITSKELSSIPKSDIKRFYKKLRQCIRFTFGGKEYLLTHGGISTNSKQITYVSTQQLIKGVGDYELDVDKAWFENEPNVIQIHGHRNIENSKNSWSLEGEVEFGGVLKYVEITRDNVYFGAIKNNKFKIREDNKEEDIKQNVFRLNTLNQEVNEMSKSRFVRCKKLNNNIASLNFTKNCFKRKQWNDITIKARGLFVDRTTGKVVARGYEKFFNLNERTEVTLEYVKRNYNFPLYPCNKYNGYLGIISHLNGELAFYTKSTDISGEYAQKFKEIFYKYTNELQREYLLKNIIEKYDCSITCEVIDTKFDPHIIEPEVDECIVLLDCIKNDLEYIPLQFVYNDMIYFCDILNEHIIVKEWDKIIKTPNELDEYVKEALQKNIEGYVIFDSNNKMFKLKTNYYNEWKSCRYLMQQINRHQGYFEMRLSNTPLQVKFGRWFADNYDNFVNPKELNILEARKLFYNEE